MPRSYGGERAGGLGEQARHAGRALLHRVVDELLHLLQLFGVGPGVRSIGCAATRGLARAEIFKRITI